MHADVACGGGALDDAVRNAAGVQLTDALVSACGDRILEIGDTVTTPAFALPAQYIIHARAPSAAHASHNQLLSDTFAAVFNAFDQLQQV